MTQPSKKTACPNPLFEKWLEEWKSEAKEKKLEVEHSFNKALKSLRKYPLKLKSGKDCMILQYFGSNLCTKLDRRLAEYRKEHQDVSSVSNKCSTINIQSTSSYDVNVKHAETTNFCKPVKRKKNVKNKNESDSDTLTYSPKTKKKQYVPVKKSGAYGLLVALGKESQKSDYPGFLTKSVLQEKAQLYCESSYSKCEAQTFYSAWNSMTTLVKKCLVWKHGNPCKYALTEEGKILAKKLLVDLETDNSNTFTEINCLPKKVGAKYSPTMTSCNVSSTKSVNKYNYDLPKKTYTHEKRMIMNLSPSPEPEVERRELKGNVAEKSNRVINISDDDCEDNIDVVMKKIEKSEITNRNYTSPVKNSDHSTNIIVETDSPELDSTFEQLIFLPQSFKIILIVDNNETIGKAKSQSYDETLRELRQNNINFVVRSLKVGDFAWIAQNDDGKELVLPYIVERKRMDDLAKSIKDKRFHEQKFRLRQCGIPNVIYLIEKFGNDNSRLGLPFTSLNQSIVNTQVVDKFFVKTTNNHSQTMLYLSVLTNTINEMFKDKTLISSPRNNLENFDVEADLIPLMTFDDLNRSSVKTKKLKAKDMMAKQLLVLKGVSDQMAKALAEKYKTPRCLKEFYENDEKKNAIEAMSNLSYGTRNIGAAISKRFYDFYTMSVFP